VPVIFVVVCPSASNNPVTNEQIFIRSDTGDVGFGILRAVAMKSSIFWDIMPCRLVKVNLACRLLNADFLLGLFSDPKDLHDMFLQNIS
jgi:hypothetical protein